MPSSSLAASNAAFAIAAALASAFHVFSSIPATNPSTKYDPADLKSEYFLLNVS